jgi:hypothetical protein
MFSYVGYDLWMNALSRRQWALSKTVCGVDLMNISTFCKGFPRWSTSNDTILGGAGSRQLDLAGVVPSARNFYLYHPQLNMAEAFGQLAAVFQRSVRRKILRSWGKVPRRNNELPTLGVDRSC